MTLLLERPTLRRTSLHFPMHTPARRQTGTHRIRRRVYRDTQQQATLPYTPTISQDRRRRCPPGLHRGCKNSSSSLGSLSSSLRVCRVSRRRMWASTSNRRWTTMMANRLGRFRASRLVQALFLPSQPSQTHTPAHHAHELRNAHQSSRTPKQKRKKNASTKRRTRIRI